MVQTFSIVPEPVLSPRLQPTLLVQLASMMQHPFLTNALASMMAIFFYARVFILSEVSPWAILGPGPLGPRL